MRLPRVRFTIAGLMLLTLLVGVGLWYDKQARKRRSPSVAESLAQSNLTLATFERQMAEIDRDYLKLKTRFDRVVAMPPAVQEDRDLRARGYTSSDMPILRWKGQVETRRPANLDDLAPPPPTPDRTREREAEAKELEAKLARLRAAEAAAQAAYDRERARRLSWW